MPRITAAFLLSLLALLPLVLGGCSSDGPAVPESPTARYTRPTDDDPVAKRPDGHPATLYEVLTNDPRFATFRKLVDLVGMQTAFQLDRYYTVFAPTEDAFRRLSPAELARLQRPESRSRLKEVIYQHIIGGWVNLRTDRCLLPPDLEPEADAEHLPRLPRPGDEHQLLARNGNTLAITLDDSTARIDDDATTPRTGMWCINGWIYPIDRLLEPPQRVSLLSALAEDPRFRQTLAAIVRSSFTTWLRQQSITHVTLLVPTDDALREGPPAARAELEGGASTVRDFLIRHAVRGSLDAAALRDTRSITTLDGLAHPVTTSGGTISIDGVALIDPAKPLTSNDGTIHALAAPLPDHAAGAGNGNGD